MSDEECSICFEAPVDFTTDCNHGFCNICITNWLLLNNNCPICRKEFYDYIAKFKGLTYEERIIRVHYIFYRVFLEERFIPRRFFVNAKLPNTINISYQRRLYRFDNRNFNNCKSRY